MAQITRPETIKIDIYNGQINKTEELPTQEAIDYLRKQGYPEAYLYNDKIYVRDDSACSYPVYRIYQPANYDSDIDVTVSQWMSAETNGYKLI